MSSLSFPLDLDRPPDFVKDELDERDIEDELSYIESCQQEISRWTDANLFTPALILQRLTEESQDDREHRFEGIRSIFSQATANSSEAGLDAASFTTLVTQRIALPSPILQGVGPILFHMICYTSSFLFPATTTPTYLNLDALILGVAILTPDLNPLSKGQVSSYHVGSRCRTEKDGRRIIFQALATLGTHVEDKPSAPKAVDAIRPSANSLFFIDVNAEDPQTTDLLDALVASQPGQLPYKTKVARSFFKGVAKALLAIQVQQGDSEALRSPQVSKERFRAVLKPLLAWKAKQSSSNPVVVVEVEREAGRLVEEIFSQPEAENIGWNRFNDRVEKSIPDLAKDLGELLGAVFGTNRGYEL